MGAQPAHMMRCLAARQQLGEPLEALPAHKIRIGDFCALRRRVVINVAGRRCTAATAAFLWPHLNARDDAAAAIRVRPVEHFPLRCLAPLHQALCFRPRAAAMPRSDVAAAWRRPAMATAVLVLVVVAVVFVAPRVNPPLHQPQGLFHLMQLVLVHCRRTRKPAAVAAAAAKCRLHAQAAAAA
eukprot:359902-Chlamydomonas_euryale.AAC.4